MAVSYRIDSDKRLVITTLTDTLSFAECSRHHGQLAADPDFQPDFSELMDGSGLTWVELNSTAIFDLSRTYPFGPRSRRAINCGESLKHFGLARMFQTLARGKHGDIQVFRSAEESVRWLSGELLS